jgi:ribonuclease ZC3H12
LNCPTVDPHILDELEHLDQLCYTPSRFIENKLIVPYDDRFILKAAAHFNGVIVSNDNYRDLIHENKDWKRIVETRYFFRSFKLINFIK